MSCIKIIVKLDWILVSRREAQERRLMVFVLQLKLRGSTSLGIPEPGGPRAYRPQSLGRAVLEV
jgi:hypothetical protein